MSIPEDRLSRISALRPPSSASGVRLPPRESTKQRDLRDLLGAECRHTELGQHLMVRRVLPEPQRFETSLNVLRLLVNEIDSQATDPTRWLFLDTETTGLSGGTGTYAFLVGLAWWENGGLIVEQHFMSDHSEEPSLLLEISRRLADRPILATFNGKSFDWPLLQTRFRMTRAAVIPALQIHFDLLHPARQLWRRQLRSVALVELERQILGIERLHDIPSETIPLRYFNFLRGGPAEPIAEVFDHNQMDLRGLVALAVRVINIFNEPETSSCSASELFGVSRVLQRRGEKLLAGRIYERALEAGLPPVAERSAQRELALLAKREGDLDRSNDWWEKLLEGSPECLEAYEQLSIFYEHCGHEFQRASSLTREALVKLLEAFHSGRISAAKYQHWYASLHHRLDRLAARQKKEWKKSNGRCETANDREKASDAAVLPDRHSNFK
jgi:uncharacterized protein